MNRREFFRKLGIASLGITAGGVFINSLEGFVPLSSAQDSMFSNVLNKQWNIVYILADDMGWNQARYEGITSYYDTPNIDKISRTGIYFTDAYTAAPVCSPARASILTGKYPARLHLTDYLPGNHYPYARLKTPQQVRALPLKEVTIAEMLKPRGYTSGMFGKWHLNYNKKYRPERPGDAGSQGFDEVFATVKPKLSADPNKDAHHVIAITNHALRFIEKNKDRPFFAYVSHHVVHRPLMEHKDLINYYKTKPHPEDKVNNPIMGAMIARMDWGVGEILKKLDELKLTDKTIVVFFSDNGGFKYLQDQAPLRGGKAMVFEGGIRVPFAIKWPGVIKPGSVSHEPVISNDFWPTFADVASAHPNVKNIDGVSLIPILEGKGQLNRDALYWHYPHYHRQGYKPSGAIRLGEYKLIEWYERAIYNMPRQIGLYHITEDISETTNLANDMPQKATEMREQFHQWLHDVRAQLMTKNPNFDPAKQYLPEKNWDPKKNYEYLDMEFPDKQE